MTAYKKAKEKGYIGIFFFLFQCVVFLKCSFKDFSCYILPQPLFYRQNLHILSIPNKVLSVSLPWYKQKSLFSRE